jgi:23S rRNA (cytidine1920-2'-O)/16S rRNA (cytidine1409-2'-O)-methyltransferase
MVAERTGLSRAQARGLILAGRVQVDGTPHTKPGASVPRSAAVVVAEPMRYVSRGGEKLEAALATFALDVRGLSCLDVGASTGGFTDALLAHGAARVVALDVGYGQLAWRLRNDPRVEVLERTNVRLLADDAFPEPFDLITIDTSFISLRSVVPAVIRFLCAGGAIVALVKPQFEVGRERVGNGVVRDPRLHRAVLRELREALSRVGAIAVDVTVSPLRGPAGNVEFFFLLRRSGAPIDDLRIDRVVDAAHQKR